MTVAFWIIAAVIVIGAFGAVAVTNLMHSVLFLALTLLGMAALYVTLMADFIAAIQVMIYVGAVVVLFIFGIMLIHRGDMVESNLPGSHVGVGTLSALVVAGLLVFGVVTTKWPVSSAAPRQETIATISGTLFNTFAIPFEIAGILLLVAVVGAIILAKEVTQK